MRRQFRADVQGLRALAVLLVVTYHSGVTVLGGGYIGVDVFFVISGFLITSHLDDALAATGTLRLREFYARRVRRILPASIATLVATAVAAVVFLPPLLLPATFREIAATALYGPNIWFALERTNYLAESAPSVVQQYWSLGVEEQFYLVWPLLLLVLFKVARGRRRLVLIGAAVLVGVSFGANVWLTEALQPYAFFLLPTRAWQLGAGALLAITVARVSNRGQTRVAGVAAWTGLATIGAAAFLMDSGTAYPGIAALAPTLGAVALILGSNGNRWSPHRLLAVRPAQWLGKISYSVYLVHWPLLTIPALAATGPLPLAVTLLLGAISLPLAWLSWKFIEEPFRRPRRNERPARTLSFAVGGPSVIAATSVALALLVSNASLSTPREAPAFALTTSPQSSADVPWNLRPGLWDASDDVPSIYGDDCHKTLLSSTSGEACLPAGVPVEAARTVALFGDSHAAQWYPALEAATTAGDISLQVYTRADCGAVARTTDSDLCIAWRSNVLDHLSDSPPDVIVSASYTYGYTFEAGTEGLAAATAAMLSSLPSQSELVLIGDTPFVGTTPAICLSSNVEDAARCDRTRSDAIDLEARSIEVAAAGPARLELTDYFCNERTCPVIIDDVLAYRDDHHITVQMARALAPVVTERVLN